MFKGKKKPKDPKDIGKKGSSPKHSKDPQEVERTQNIYNEPFDYSNQSSPPPVPGRTPSTSRPPAGAQFDKPWRPLDWDKRKHMRDELRKLNISIPDVPKLRILVHGPVGAGKSSFINSIDSIFQERMTSAAIAEAASDRSFTKTFQAHNIKDGRYGSFLPFTFYDIMGLEAGHHEGVETEDLLKVLKGHIREGYTFNPTNSCPKDHPKYNSNPKLSDRIHCLVSVIPANQVSIMPEEVFSKMKKVREKAGATGIPQVTVLTKIDEPCPLVAEDIKQVYRSRKIKDKMQECSNRLGIPMSCIFPVKCYHEEIQLNDTLDVLLLSALDFILNFANDHVAVLADAPAHTERKQSIRHKVNFSEDSSKGDVAPPPANVGGSREYYNFKTDSSPKGPPPPPRHPLPR